MSKSRNRKWYEHEDDDTEVKKKNKRFADRRKEKRLKSALKQRDHSYFEQQDE
jgi:hypothetical protein